MKTVIFLGAGASAADGAPVQSHLLANHFDQIRNEPVARSADRELVTFFATMFGLDLDVPGWKAEHFPTFEEALGLIDLAIARRESFRDWSLPNVASNSGRLYQVREHLILAMARVIGRQLGSATGRHRELVENLHREGLLTDAVFITTNYDLLADNALYEPHGPWNGSTMDYGVAFRNGSDLVRAGGPVQTLLKIHGSMNWLYCPSCAAVDVTPSEKGVLRLVDAPGEACCSSCDTLRHPVIVPPTYYKDMTNVFLATTWNRAEQLLRAASHIVFCGYSLPDADMHVKYLLKRAQVGGRADWSRQRYTVLNDHPAKGDAERRDEEHRYRRFLGPRVEYLRKGFTEFAADPAGVLRAPANGPWGAL